MVLASGAGLLLNFGDGIALTAAFGFVIVSCLTLLYGLGIYLWRVRNIRRRRTVRYHDGVGPTVLCFILILAITINFGLRLVE